MTRLPSGRTDAVEFEFGRNSAATALNGVLANVPNLWRQVSGIAQWYRHDSTLPPRLRELAILAIAGEFGADYAIAQHIPLAAATGLSQITIAAALKRPTAVGGDASAIEQVGVDVALSMVRHDSLSDVLWKQAEKEWSVEQIVELCVLASFYRMICTLCKAWELPPEPNVT